MKSLLSLVFVTLFAACSNCYDESAAPQSNDGIESASSVLPTLTQHASNRAEKGNVISVEANILKLDEVGLWTDWDGNLVVAEVNPRIAKFKVKLTPVF